MPMLVSIHLDHTYSAVQRSQKVADCTTREFTDKKKLEKSVSEFINLGLCGGKCCDDFNCSTESLLCLKDWHFVKEIDGLKSLLTDSAEDKDMCDMAAEELAEAVEEETKLQHLLLKLLLLKDDADERDCILEVRAGMKNTHRRKDGSLILLI